MANDISASIILIMKKRILSLALLFCGQSLFAGYGQGLRGTEPFEHCLAGLAGVVGRDFAGFFAQAWGAGAEDFGSILQSQDDDDSDSESEFEDEPRWYNLRDEEVEALEHEILNTFAGACEDVIERIAELLTETTRTLTKTQRKRLFCILFGETGQGGLLNDRDSDVRHGVAGAIGRILASGSSDKNERTLLLKALIGEKCQGGLLNDNWRYVREMVLEVVKDLIKIEDWNILSLEDQIDLGTARQHAW